MVDDEDHFSDYRGSEGNKAITKIDPKDPKKAYSCNHPLVYEEAAIIEQKKVFKLLRSYFREFKEEVKTTNKTQNEMEKIISKRKIKALDILSEGSFFPRDMKRHASRVRDIIDRIYDINKH
jgi:hypothetical protein